MEKKMSQPAKQPQLAVNVCLYRNGMREQPMYRSARNKYLDKYICGTTLAYARIPMRIHDSDGLVVQWSEIQ